MRVTPSPTQKMIGPVRSVSFMMLPSAGLEGFSTVRAFCQMWSRLMPSSGQHSHTRTVEDDSTDPTTLSFVQVRSRRGI